MRAGHSSRSRWALALTAGLSAVWVASPAIASPKAAANRGTVVTAVSTKSYGSVLIVGGNVNNPLTGDPIFEFSGDGGGKFGCNTKRALGFDPDSNAEVPLTCTGPESDMVDNNPIDDWPALTSTSAPIAGPGVNPKLLGTVYRHGIGHQVTYGGRPLYLFVPRQAFFLIPGEGYMETVEPLPPWHGFWFLVSSNAGQPAPGVATIEVGTLKDGKKVVCRRDGSSRWWGPGRGVLLQQGSSGSEQLQWCLRSQVGSGTHHGEAPGFGHRCEGRRHHPPPRRNRPSHL